MKVNLLKTVLYYLFPFLWALLFVCACFVPERLFRNFHQFLPLVLIIIFYFALFSSKRLNVIAVFILGILADFLSPSIFGLNSFIFVGMFFMSNLLQPYIYAFSFKNLWCVFCGLMLLCDILWAWFTHLFTGVWVSASFWLVQYVFVCLFYPIIIWITGKLNHLIKDI